jgi:hypothetical protein
VGELLAFIVLERRIVPRVGLTLAGVLVEPVELLPQQRATVGLVLLFFV